MDTRPEDYNVARHDVQATSSLQAAEMGNLTPEQVRQLTEARMSNEVMRVSEATRPVQVVWEVRGVVENSALVATEAPGFENQYLDLQFYWALRGLGKKLDMVGEVGEAERDFLGYSAAQLGVERLNQLKEKDRLQLKEVVDQEMHFFIAMSKFTLLWRQYEPNAGSVDRWAEKFLLPFSYHLQAEDLEALLSEGPALFKSENEQLPEHLRNSEKLTNYKDMLDKTLRTYVAISLCEKPEQFLDLMRRPGWDFLVKDTYVEIRNDMITMVPVMAGHEIVGFVSPGGTVKMLEEPDPDGDQGKWYLVELNDGTRGYVPLGAVSNVVDQNFLYGKPEDWKKGIRRNDDKSGSVNDLSLEENSRGVLTKPGNPFTRNESTEDREALRQDVLKYVAGGDKLVEEVAYRAFKMLGMAARASHERFEVYNSETKTVEQKLLQEGFPTADDMIKILETALWQEKQTESGHNCGPDSTKRQIARFATDFLRFTVIDASKLGAGLKTVGEETSYRSFFELWWGYAKDGNRPAEKAYKLGDLPWKKMPPDVFRAWMLRIFQSARKEKGMLDMFTRENWQPDQLIDQPLFREFQKVLNITVQPSVIVDGKFRGTTPKDWSTKVEKKRLKVVFGNGAIDSPTWSISRRTIEVNPSFPRAENIEFAEAVAEANGFTIPTVITGKTKSPSDSDYFKRRGIDPRK